MQVRTYRAKSLVEAVQKIRNELGPDAMIVQSREVSTGWWDRISRGRRFEVRARQRPSRPAPDRAAPPGRPPTNAAQPPQDATSSPLTGPERNALESAQAHLSTEPLGHPTQGQDTIDTNQVDATGHEHERTCARGSDDEGDCRRLDGNTPEPGQNDVFNASLNSPVVVPEDRLGEESSEQAAATISPKPGDRSPSPEALPFDALDQPFPDAATTAESHVQAIRTAVRFEVLSELIEADVPEDCARELIRTASDTDQAIGVDGLRQTILEVVAQDVSATGPIDLTAGEQKVIALVGPTGVGKTTTIAKLAANLRLCERRRVGMITVDTFRVAAVDQLQTYAEIMDLPLEVATTPRAMRDALTRLSDEEVILIDTAGRSPHDQVHLQQLKSMLIEAMPQEVQLVISSTASARHLQQVVDSFLPLGCTSLLATKLDEVTTLGNLVAIARDCRLPFSYLTCGQNVPDDIVLAEANSLLLAMLGQQPVSSLV